MSGGTGGTDDHAEAKNIFNLVDVNHDTFVSREEWAAAFLKIDKDGDGVISRKDWTLRNGSSEMYDKVSKKVKGNLNKQEWIAAFDALDQNEDGLVSLREWLTQSVEGQLAAGWVRGDKVLSQIAHNQVQVGDEGVVDGPSKDQTCADAAQRVCVDFKGKGTLNVVAASQIMAAPISHGYAKFDLILSRLDHNNIKMGDPGIVMGPSNNPKSADFADRVLVNFGPGKGQVNILATTQIEGIPLAGNYEKGDVVFSKIVFNKIKIGDQGHVVGPPPNPEDASERVRISFGASGFANMNAVSQIYGPDLACGYRKGDKVQSKISHQDWLKNGDYGIVMGACSSNAEDKASRIAVAFGEDRKRVNILATTQIEPAPLAGVWFKGDTAVSTINFNTLQIGMKGLVLGTTSLPKAADASSRICVDFGSPAGILNILITQVQGEPLAGGWLKGDKVISKIAHNDVVVGDEGVVVGPTGDLSDPRAGERVRCFFGSKGRLNVMADSQIASVTLAFGWAKGDICVSKINHQAIEIGDKAIVLGPCRSSPADAARRVCVDFNYSGEGKGTVNILADTQIERPLTGNWVKGEKVVATKAFKTIAQGQKGTISGPGSGTQVKVDFGLAGDSNIVEVEATGCLEADHGDEGQVKKVAENVDAKYTAFQLKFGGAMDAAFGIDHLLGSADGEYFSKCKKAGSVMNAMEQEIDSKDRKDYSDIWRYIRNGEAGSDSPDLPAHIEEDLNRGSYHGGGIERMEFDMGHEGMRLADFVNSEEAKLAKLEDHHVAAARLYTSSAFRQINDPLRKEERPHAWPVVTKTLDEAVKKLRAVNARKKGFMQPLDLWRGMQGVKLDMKLFQEEGGTELAPMSTSEDRQVAEKYSNGKDAIIFHYKARGTAKGVSLRFLSLYPKESEWLYPPGTFLAFDGEEPTGGGKTVVHVAPQMPSDESQAEVEHMAPQMP